MRAIFKDTDMLPVILHSKRVLKLIIFLQFFLLVWRRYFLFVIYLECLLTQFLWLLLQVTNEGTFNFIQYTSRLQVYLGKH